MQLLRCAMCFGQPTAPALSKAAQARYHPDEDANTRVMSKPTTRFGLRVQAAFRCAALIL